jgi:hypothetical protein
VQSFGPKADTSQLNQPSRKLVLFQLEEKDDRVTCYFKLAAEMAKKSIPFINPGSGKDDYVEIKSKLSAAKPFHQEQARGPGSD